MLHSIHQNLQHQVKDLMHQLEAITHSKQEYQNRLIMIAQLLGINEISEHIELDRVDFLFKAIADLQLKPKEVS